MWTSFLLQTTAPKTWGAKTTDLVSQFWPILLTALLGGIAMYLLLPRAKRFPPLWGALAAALALVALGWFVVHSEWLWLEALLFYVFAGLAITFGGLMITQRNPVHAALSFAMVVLSTCGLFLLQAAPFLMAATIIIYAGAIVVTFLFVIMLAQQSGLTSADQRSREPFLATVAGFVLLAAILCVLNQNYGMSAFDEHLDRISAAAKGNTVAQFRQALGDDDEVFEKLRKHLYGGKLPPLHKTNLSPAALARKELHGAVVQAQVYWNAIKPPKDKPRDDDHERTEPTPEAIDKFHKELQKVRDLALVVRYGHGGVQPDASLVLSKGSGTPANAKPSVDAHGNVKEGLPAANVAGLGKALFTDYLLAVELAGTLLLIATIGAIAIAGRRPEGLR